MTRLSVPAGPVGPAGPPRSAAIDPRTVAATVVGNFIELFDWFAFGLFVPIFAGQFFPSRDPVSSLLGALAVFGTGMLLRPLGGVLLGRFADRHGRRPAMLLSIAMMGGGSLVVGAAPTHAQVGLLAPLVLLLGRTAQGLSGGGEWPAAVTYLMELAPPDRRCRYGSLFGASAAAGALVAALLGAGLSASLSHAALTGWGWRLPFLAGGLLGVGLLVVRSRMRETPVFQRQVRTDRTRGSLREVMRAHRRSVGLVVAFAAGTTMLSGTWTTVVPAIGQRLAPADRMFLVITLVTAAATVLQVPLGMLADRVGVYPFLACYALGAVVVGPIAYLNISGGFGSLLFSYGTGVALITVLTAVMPKVLASAYPPQVRTVGIGLPHGTTTAVFGGFSPWLATFLGGHGLSGLYIGVVAVTSLVSSAAAVAIARRHLTGTAGRSAADGVPGSPADGVTDAPAEGSPDAAMPEAA
ncbi:MFS transporter [Actinomadura verrucosospora]|uniref:Alpha-ketoglutarate transporter n=1 Tax=Actinomadura verrucosospora TaxID=46165 RepID=A0A7D3ZW64_ACTVE|nr:MFS transporter [Actinomadura verrucosospora]QKG19884.1 alpha-ketoglutarate transporter [Actinomadura verrucosospora]